jgi:hypothetical protein
VNILTSGQYLRLTGAYAVRGLRRAFPLVEDARPKVDDGMVRDVRHVIVLGAAFAAGVSEVSDTFGQSQRLAVSLVYPEVNPAGAVSVAAYALAMAIVHTTEALQLTLAGYERPAAIFADARTYMRQAVSYAERALDTATVPDELNCIAAARSADLAASMRHHERENRRLGGTWLANDPDDALGPPLDPSEGGPLGVLWPQGSPRWYHDDVAEPIIVSASAFLADPQGHKDATDIVYWDDEPDDDKFVEKAEAFLTSVAQVAQRDGWVPQQRNVFLVDPDPHAGFDPDSDVPPRRAAFASRLVGAGATVWRSDDFDGLTPNSAEAFARAVAMVHRRTVGRGHLVAVHAPNGAASPTSPPVPTPSTTKPDVAAGNWQPVATEADAYASVIERPDSDAGGWPTVD